MSLPGKLRSFYDKIVTPASEMSGIRGGPRWVAGGGTNTHTQAVQNLFFIRFQDSEAVRKRHPAHGGRVRQDEQVPHQVPGARKLVTA